MKVTFLTTAYPTIGGSSYAGSFHKTLAEALVRQGAAVEVIAPIPTHRLFNGFRRSVPRRYEFNGVVVERPHYFTAPRMGELAGLSRQFANALMRTDRPDVFHSHFVYPCGIASARVVRRTGIPSVLTLHGSDVHVYPNRNKRTLESFRFAVRNNSCVTAVSHALAERTLSLAGVSPIVQPLGVNPSIFNAGEEKFVVRTRLDLPADNFLVLFVGNLTKAKGVHDLLQAVTSSDGVTAVFCGDGPLRQQVRECSNAILAGNQSPLGVAEFLAAADVLVLPSHHEGLGLVLIEAGFCRVPVIGSNVGGIPETIGNDRGLLVPPHQPDAIRDAINIVRRDCNRVEEMVESMETYVRQHYDVNQCAQEFLEIYERCQH